MRRIRLSCTVALGVAVLSACGAGAQPSAPAQQAVDRAVRTYIDHRNHGDLEGLLATSCDDLYTSARNLLELPGRDRRSVVRSMTRHPVRVHSVTVQRAADFRLDATLTGSTGTAEGRKTATQHVTVRQYEDGYRVCSLSS